MPNPQRNDTLRKQERSIFLGLLLDLAGFLPAAAIAVLSGSMLLTSDLLDYARSIFTTFMGWQILRAIRLGRLQGYDYGTDKIQALGGIVGSMLYLGTLGLFAVWAIGRLFEPGELHPTFTLLGVLFQLIDFAISSWLWRYNLKLSRLEFSPVMEMQWRTYRADALLSLAMVIGLLLTLLLDDFAWSVYLDPIMALIFIAYVGLSFLPALVNGFNDLLDKTLQEDLQLRIDRRLAEHFDDYTAFHGVRSRRAGGRIFIELTLSFDHDATMATVLVTIGQLREKLERDIPGSEVRVVLMP
jgi:divalent metal cation (Fe/Co/Zn/Cd) transporter